MENNWLNLMNLVKTILISTEIVHHLKDKKKKINKLAEERSSGFRNKSNTDSLICKYKTEGRSPKDLLFIKIQ